MIRRGVHTSEFLAAVAAGVGSLIAGLEGALSPHWAAICSTAAAVAYAISRGLAKKGNDSTRPPG